MRLVRAAVVLALLAVGIAGCGSDDDEAAGWAIVKVEIVDGPALAAICIDSICQEFDPVSPVRSGEFSAYVEPRSTFEVLRVGEPSGEGASGGSPVGGCMLLRLTSDSGEFVAGCDPPPAGN
jgi:hypothetical protein